MRRMSGRVMVAILVCVMGVSCNPGGKGGPAVDSRGVTKEGKPLLDQVNELEQEITRLEKQFEAIQRKPRLNEEQVNTFDLTGAPSKGPEKAKLTMVVFSDFQCPFCARFAEVSKKLLEKYPEDLRLVFMNYPLDSTCNPSMSRPMHDKACLAAEAALAAGEQGKFWEMHDWLFQNQRTFTQESILEFAKSQGLKVDQIKQAIETQKFKDVIQKQANQLAGAGGRGTPSVYINGMMVLNPRWDDVEISLALIEDLLHPKAEGEEEKPTVPVAVKKPQSLPPAKVILDDGTRLEDRLADLKKRLAALDLGARTSRPTQRPTAPDTNKVYSFDLAKSPVFGGQEAKVTVVYFCDLLTPECQALAEIIKEVGNKFGDQVKIAFKNSPNPMKPNSLPTHEALLEANAQGKFWEMQEKIFKNREQITPELLRKLAEEVGLKMDQYDAAIKDHRHRQAIITDFREAKEAGVPAASGLFINGKYQASPNKDAVLAAVSQALEGH